MKGCAPSTLILVSISLDADCFCILFFPQTSICKPPSGQHGIQGSTIWKDPSSYDTTTMKHNIGWPELIFQSKLLWSSYYLQYWCPSWCQLTLPHGKITIAKPWQGKFWTAGLPSSLQITAFCCLTNSWPDPSFIPGMFNLIFILFFTYLRIIHTELVSPNSVPVSLLNISKAWLPQ